MRDIESIQRQAEAAMAAADKLRVLDEVRVRFLGKRGEVTALLKEIGSLPPEQRRETGQAINRVKQELQNTLEIRRRELEELVLEQRLATEAVDVTLPGRGEVPGGWHPVTRTARRIEALFRNAGFEVAEGPEIEDDYHNFEALNIPPHHPARAMHDTFYVAGQSRLLRPHTSPVQTPAMDAHSPPTPPDVPR